MYNVNMRDTPRNIARLAVSVVDLREMENPLDVKIKN